MKGIAIALSTALVLVATSSAFAGTSLSVRAEEADGTLIDSDVVPGMASAKAFRDKIKATYCPSHKGGAWYYQVGKQKRVKHSCPKK